MAGRIRRHSRPDGQPAGRGGRLLRARRLRIDRRLLEDPLGRLGLRLRRRPDHRPDAARRAREGRREEPARRAAEGDRRGLHGEHRRRGEHPRRQVERAAHPRPGGHRQRRRPLQGGELVHRRVELQPRLQPARPAQQRPLGTRLVQQPGEPDLQEGLGQALHGHERGPERGPGRRAPAGLALRGEGDGLVRLVHRHGLLVRHRRPPGLAGRVRLQLGRSQPRLVGGRRPAQPGLTAAGHLLQRLQQLRLPHPARLPDRGVLRAVLVAQGEHVLEGRLRDRLRAREHQVRDPARRTRPRHPAQARRARLRQRPGGLPRGRLRAQRHTHLGRVRRHRLQGQLPVRLRRRRRQPLRGEGRPPSDRRRLRGPLLVRAQP